MSKFPCVSFWILISISGLTPLMAQTEPAGASMASPSTYRISALVDSTNGVRVGFVNVSDGTSFFISEGEESHGVFVIEADYLRERVLLSLQNKLRELYLTDDPDSRVVHIVPTAPVDATGVTAADLGIDQLQATPSDYPSAGLQAMMAQFPDSVPTNFGHQPNAIQQYLEENPEVAISLGKSPGRYGSGIEEMLRLNPDLSNNLERTQSFPTSP
ncbi:MAG: hypothetical protein H7A43_05055 [Verrucomicrobia bacterium]|nr:hypothetical protein [Verrucomicrobiota bacterium]